MIKVDKDYIIKIRREIHEYPETGFDLPRTTAIVKRELENMQKHVNTGDNASEWDKKYYYGLTEQIELLDHLIDRI